MDNVLTKLNSQPDVKTFPGLADSIRVAREVLKISAVPVHERRANCLNVFQQTLAASKPKLSLLALEGLQLLLRDATLLNDWSTQKPEDSLSVQMLKCLEHLPEWDKQIQCQMITVIVQLISSNEVNVSLNDVYESLQICTKTFSLSEDVSVKLSVRAAITQMLNSFCSNRHAKMHSNPSQEEIAVLMDMTALLSEVYRRLSSAETIDDLQLGLDSVYSVLSAQPETFYKHPPLLNVFSTELVPCLLCLLHSTDDKPAPIKSLLSITPTTSLKFSVFTVPESARSFYQVVEQVIRLLARVPDLEPLALELFRSSLLSPHVARRSEALKLLKRLFSTPQRFVEYLDLCAREPQFWPAILLCLEECSKVPGSDSAVDSIRVMNALFAGLCDQLQPSACSKYTPAVHEILKNAAQTQNCVQAKQAIQITVRRQVSVETNNLAQQFVCRLTKTLEEWVQLKEVQKLDQKIQEFAAQIAQEFTDLEVDHSQTQSLLNTDAVYLTTFAVLSQCLRAQSGEKPDRVTLFEQVTGSGCIVYANENWLNAVYDLLLTQNVFAGLDIADSLLVKVINDYDGYNKKYLSTFMDDEEPDESTEEGRTTSEQYKNFESWIRNQLASSWSTVLSILSKFSLKLDKKNATDKLHTEGVEATLDAITSLLKLLIKLRLPSEIVWVFERIGEEVCLVEELRHFVIKSIGTENKKPWRINRIDALSISLLLDNCIECGTIAPASWKHTVRTIEYVTELEKYLFRLTKTANVTYDANEASLADLLSKIVPNELSLATVGRVLDELMLKIDGFFEDAPKILNLPSACALLTAMCTTDEDNLRNIEGAGVKVVAEVYVPACALPRIARLIAGNVQRRPLVHRLRLWGTVKGHYIDTISSKYPSDIVKLSISTLYDSMRALLGVELEGSCFHQSLFTAYQTVLCCEVCSAETQEQIVTNLANFVEDLPQQIGSGWKPLFGALKAIRISVAKQKPGSLDDQSTQQSALTPVNYAVIDIFQRYIQIGDPRILIPTALEFIHCVMHYLQSPEGFEQLPLDLDTVPSKEHERDAQFNRTAFFFVSELKRQLLLCFEMISSPDSPPVPAPTFLLNRLKHREQSMETVDETLVDAKLEDVSDLATCLLEDTAFDIQPARLNERLPSNTQTAFPWADWTDSQRCIAELLLSLVDELAGLTLTCSRETLSQLLTGLAEFVIGLRQSELAHEIRKPPDPARVFMQKNSTAPTAT